MTFRAALAAIVILAPVPAVAAPAYRAAGLVPLGAPDRWDYVVADAGSGRVYVAHGDRVTVVDGRARKVVGSVMGMPGGTHGTGIVGHLGVTDDGEAGQAVVFDTRTLKVLRRVAADEDADGIAMDAASGHALVANGDPGTVSIIDPASGVRVATAAVGEAVEYPAVADGRAFVAGKDKGDVAVFDPAGPAAVVHWPMPDCVKPHGLVVDPVAHRVFVGCVNNKAVVLDARDGRVVASLAIGPGSDSLAWDAKRRRLFSANGGDGTITVIQQDDADHYRALEPIPTRLGGRNMAVDPVTGRLFVAAGEVMAGSAPRRVRPGSLALLMFDPN